MIENSADCRNCDRRGKVAVAFGMDKAGRNYRDPRFVHDDAQGDYCEWNDVGASGESDFYLLIFVLM